MAKEQLWRRRHIVEEFGESWETSTRGMWEYFIFKRVEAKKIRDDAAREKQEGIQGQCQQESPFREILEQAGRNEDTGCSSEIMRKSYSATEMGRFQRRMHGKREVVGMGLGSYT